MTKGILWVVEVRDVRYGEWFMQSAFFTRVAARKNQVGAKAIWNFTRVVKYVREAA